MKKPLSLLLILSIIVSLVIPFSVTATEEGSLILNFDSLNNFTTDKSFPTNLAIETNNRTEGLGALWTGFTSPTAQSDASKIGGMVFYDFNTPIDLSSYDTVTLQYWTSYKMPSSAAIQINLCSGRNQDGFNFLFGVDNQEAGWHTLTLNLLSPSQTIPSGEPDLSGIDRIRFTYFNYSDSTEITFLLFDNMRAFNTKTNSEDTSSETVSSEITVSEDTAEIVYGDVNKNGDISSVDALMVLQYTVKKITLTEEQLLIADVVRPIYVSSADALAILQYSVGKISEFDPPQHIVEESSLPEPSQIESSEDEYSYVAPAVTYYTNTLEKFGNSNAFFTTHTEDTAINGIKSVVQTDSAYDASLNFDVDAQMVNIYVRDSAAMKLNTWAKKYDGKVSVFTPINRAAADYPAMYPDRSGKDEQRFSNGNLHGHGSYGFYMIPTTQFVEYKKSVLDACFNERYDYEVEMVVFEEPEIFLDSVYCDGFKEEWVNFYGTAWEDPASSVSAKYRTSKLAVYLFKRAITELASYIKSRSPSTKVIIAAHSSVNYNYHNIAGGISNYGDLPCVDGIIGQTWSDTGAYSMKQNGSSIVNEFLSELVDYGTYANGYNEKWVYALADASTDRAADTSITEAMKKEWYTHQLASQLMYANINRFEPCIWPGRAFGNASDEYKTVQLNMIRAFTEASAQETDLYAGTGGVYIATSDTMSWQNGVNGEAGRHCHYALTLALAEKGILPNALNIDMIDSADDLKNVRVLVLSYDYQKPLSEKINVAIAEWVKKGGNLLYIGGYDDMSTDKTQWWGRMGQTPYQNLMNHIGVGVDTIKNNLTNGNFTWQGSSIYCGSFKSATIAKEYGSCCASYAGKEGTYPITKALLFKNGALVGFEAPTVNGGRVISYGLPVSWFTNNSKGSSMVRQLVQYSCDMAGLPYWEKNIYLVKRGNIMAAHGLGATETIHGTFIALTEANLPIMTSVSIENGKSYLFKDISPMMNNSGIPSLVHYSGTMESLQETATATSIKVWGTKNATSSFRFMGNGKTYDSITVTKNGVAVDPSEYSVVWESSVSSLLFKLKFSNATPYDVVVNWK